MRVLAVVLLCAVLAPLLHSCEAPATPTEAQELVRLEAERDDAVARGDAGTATEKEAAIHEIEARIIRRRAGPIVAGIAAAVPGAAWASPFLMGLAPLFFKRGRKHYWNAVRNATPGMKGENGTRVPSPINAVLSIAKGLGWKHSSAASERCADVPAAAPSL